MKSKQVGYVLIALIVIGLAGLVVRLVAVGSNELVLEGILPIAPEVIDRVTITSSDNETELEKVAGVWLIGRDPAFGPKLQALWTATVDIDGAQLVAENPANHSRMGVGDGQGIRVAFWLGDFKQEEFIVGKWSPDVRLCYLRRPKRDQVYGIPCPLTNIFDTDPNGWRNPVVVSIPRDAVEMVEFSYPNEAFVLRRAGRGWTIDSGSGDEPADIFAVNAVLSNIEVLVARDFAGPEDTEDLDFTGADGISVRVTPLADTGFPTTRVRFLPRDDTSFFAKTPDKSTIFVIDVAVTRSLLLSSRDFTGQN
ncbi:MAG: DUF4340 domain-containing protein [Chloroflexi bacterium]|nr:DUF4340 domain-containing protein [Chloroflexota bacterium]MCI0869318.1 DUF4340 domain-containing protein [Chloroflexota bacterium]